MCTVTYYTHVYGVDYTHILYVCVSSIKCNFFFHFEELVFHCIPHWIELNTVDVVVFVVVVVVILLHGCVHWVSYVVPSISRSAQAELKPFGKINQKTKYEKEAEIRWLDRWMRVYVFRFVLYMLLLLLLSLMWLRDMMETTKNRSKCACFFIFY